MKGLKKLVVWLIGAVMIICLAGCSVSTEKKAQNDSTQTELISAADNNEALEAKKAEEEAKAAEEAKKAEEEAKAAEEAKKAEEAKAAEEAKKAEEEAKAAEEAKKAEEEAKAAEEAKKAEEEAKAAEEAAKQAEKEAKAKAEAERLELVERYSALSLKEVFASHGMKVGTCLTSRMIDDEEFEELILREFSSVTQENSMKPDYLFNKDASIAAGELVVELSKDAEKMLDWAKEKGMAVRGHTLVWHSQTPEWIFYKDFSNKSEGLADRETMLARMESYISQVFATLEEKGYQDIIYAYDVVNEAFNDDGTYRKESNWYKTIGEDYLWYAFYYADKYAPESIDLYYNDFNEQYKYKNFLKFVTSLVNNDGEFLLDGIGLQAHLYTQDNLDTYFKAVDAYASLGLKVEMTELDVSLGAWTKTLPGNDENYRTQGQYYYDLIGGMFERVEAGTLNMDAITFWGFADNLSWRSNAKPLLYDRKLNPKYAYYGALQVKELAGFPDEE